MVGKRSVVGGYLYGLCMIRAPGQIVQEESLKIKRSEWSFNVATA